MLYAIQMQLNILWVVYYLYHCKNSSGFLTSLYKILKLRCVCKTQGLFKGNKFIHSSTNEIKSPKLHCGNLITFLASTPTMRLLILSSSCTFPC